MGGILWVLIVILVIGWVIGLVAHVAFWGIHLLIVGAIILFVFNLITGRRAAS